MGKLLIKRGKYGRSKVKAFTVLSQDPGQWLSSRELCLWSGIGYRSLARALPKWYTWEYVSRRPCTTYGLGDYEYKLQARGREWLAIARAELPNYGRFISELMAWQAHIRPKWTEFMAMPFHKFVDSLHEAVT